MTKNILQQLLTSILKSDKVHGALIHNILYHRFTSQVWSYKAYVNFTKVLTPSTVYRLGPYQTTAIHGIISQIPFREPAHWAKVTYYELNTRVGEPFTALSQHSQIIIDGFTDPGWLLVKLSLF